MRKLTALILAVVMAVSFSGCAQLKERRDSKNYEKATEMMADGDYEGAEEKFAALEDYQDSAELAVKCRSWAAYNGALASMDAGEYEQALSVLSTLGGFEDSTALAGQCSDMVSIAKADGLLEAGDYQAACAIYENLRRYDGVEAKFSECCKSLFWDEAQGYYSGGQYLDALRTLACMTELDYERTNFSLAYDMAYQLAVSSDDASVKEMADSCYNELRYADAQSYFESGSYTTAKSAFEALGDFKDASEMAAKAQEEIAAQEAAAEAARQAELANSYATAMSYYNAGKYYSAYVALNALSGYSDADAMAASCKQAMPSNGSYKQSGGSGCELTIYAPSGSNYTYIKVYTSGGSFAGSVFLAPGGSSTLSLSGGSYTIKAAYGTTWWGTVELFGDSGTYTVLTDQNGYTTFSLDSGYGYSLKLSVSSGGNVGSQSVGRSGF